MATALLACVLAAGSACSSEADDGSDGGGSGAASSPGDSSGQDGDKNGGKDRSKGSAGGSNSSPSAALEMPPSSDTTDGAEPSRLPNLQPPEPVEPLASRPWPALAAGRGEVVPGLPDGLAPVADSRVVSTSVSPAGDRLQVAVEATTRSSVSAVLRSYRKRWEGHGLTPVHSPAAAGTRVLAYAQGSTTAVVTASRRKGTTRYWVHAVVHEEE